MLSQADHNLINPDTNPEQTKAFWRNLHDEPEGLLKWFSNHPIADYQILNENGRFVGMMPTAVMLKWQTQIELLQAKVREQQELLNTLQATRH